MTAEPPRNEDKELQFDRVATDTPSPPEIVRGAPAVVCEGCKSTLDTEYYQVNGHTFCDRCRARLEHSAEIPRGLAPLLVAALFGLGAGIVGAAIYYAVIAIANLEIGIVAILLGYMVGYAVRKSAGGRGGRRFQILAVALTYLSVAFAYTPLIVKAAMEHRSRPPAAAASATSTVPDPPSANARSAKSGPGLLVALAMMFGLIVALPVIVVVESVPSGLISAFIIYIGMRQAWKMTGAPTLDVSGPYRIGTASSPPL